MAQDPCHYRLLSMRLETVVDYTLYETLNKCFKSVYKFVKGCPFISLIFWESSIANLVLLSCYKHDKPLRNIAVVDSARKTGDSDCRNRVEVQLLTDVR